MGDKLITTIPGWHWTFALVILYGLAGLVLFLVRQRLLSRRSGWLAQTAHDGSVFRCRLKARFGLAAAFLLGLSLITIYLGADQDGHFQGQLLDDAGVLILTISFLEMRIYPWSPSLLEIDGSLHPVALNAYQTRLQVEWITAPEVQVLSLDHVRFKGSVRPKRADRLSSGQTLDLYRYHLGDKSFEALLSFLELKARVHLPEI